MGRLRQSLSRSYVIPLEIPAEAIRNLVCLVEAELPNLVPLRTPSGEGPSHMNVKVRDCLVRVDSVVLPNADARSLLDAIQREGGSPHESHDRKSFLVSQVKDRRSVPRGHDQQMGDASLLAGDEDCSILVPVENGEGPHASEVIAKGARVGIWHQQVAHVEFLSDLRNSWISSMSTLFSSWGRTTMTSSSQTRSFREANMNDRIRNRTAS